MAARYINPYTDFGFKKLFGEEASKDLLIDFLNAVLPQEYQIATLEFRASEQLPDNIVDRRAIFDIACTGSDGESFTVEMQKAKQQWFKDRALFYAAFPIQKQAQRGDWDFKLNPVFLVAILDFEYDVEEERRELHRIVSLKDQNGEVFSEKLHFHFLQMPLFNKTDTELQTKEDKWLYFLKNLESFDEIPLILHEPVFERAFDRAEYFNLSPMEQEIYHNSRKAYLDNVNVLRTAKEEGHAEGRAEGEAIGEARGRAEGEAEGEAKKVFEIARSMRQKGLESVLIAGLTGLSIDEIERL
jgi:predicted transposase/invertase (TIGR01784 family)